MRIWRKKSIWGAGLAGILLCGISALFLTAGSASRAHPNMAVAGSPDSQPDSKDRENGKVTVRTIRPKCDPSFTLSIKGPAQVEPYEWADLEAQLAGRVEFIRKAEGSRVRAGELLVKIAVPDLDEEVKQKESVIHQREADFRLSQANERIANAAIAVALKNIEVQEAGVEEAVATRDFRGKEHKRLQGLVIDKATTQQIVDEHERYYYAAVAGTARARAAVLKAKADWQEAQAKLEAAKADVQLKNELIAVARKDRDRARALADYAKITAPFDAVVTRRNVNQGSFVQNATTAHTQPLLRVERRDIVTVTMKVKDTFAAYVNSDTEAVIVMSELPGQAIHGKVTRFSPTLENATKDKTLLVQVDLYNGTEAEYQKFLTKEKARKVPFDDLKDGPLPLAPRITGKNAGAFHPLYPGMYGDMKLVFRHLANVYLLPSDAITRLGGTPYIYVVKDGKAVLVPVEIQVDDQKLVKVTVISKTPTGVVRKNLNGDEEVVYSNQGELMDGESVTTIPEDWLP